MTNSNTNEIAKEHDESEYWTYGKPYGRLTPVYNIDGKIRGTEHGSAQYLIDTYHMEILKAYKYICEISTHK